VIYDLFTYNGEADILEMRLNILDPYVDKFVIGEAELTFSSKAKPLYYEQQKERFKKFWPKIINAVVRNYYADTILVTMAQYFPDLHNANYPFLMAYYQKEHLQVGLEGAKDTDIIYYGDCDEIWTPQEVQENPTKIEQLNYSMYLNRRSTEPWAGTVIATYEQVKRYGLSQMRLKAQTKHQGGWHFSNMGGLDELRRKLDSYDHQEINTEDNQAKLEQRYNEGTDFLGRKHQNYTDESEWPQYLKDNREKYKHMLWQS